jgi:signal transduction histidine kinase
MNRAARDGLESEPATHSGNVGVFALAGLGITLAVLYAGALLVRVSDGDATPLRLLSQLAIGIVLPFALIGVAWWLRTNDVAAGRSWRLTLWSFGGLGIVTVLSAWQFYHILLGVPATGAVIEGFLLNVQAGAVGGLIVGVYATRAERRSEELAAERDNLARENERLEEFAHAVSHDLRSPLSVAIGNLEIAREKHDDEHLEAIDRAHDRMATLIDELRTLARQGQVVDDPESVSLDDAAETAWGAVGQNGATLDIKTDQEIQADVGRVHQLLQNLFENAVDHGGDDVSVAIGDLPDGFYVADDGPGIPEDKRETVFETGYTTGDGTGFGLSIVARIAEAHDWHTKIADGPEGGTRIEIRGVTVGDA